jgi:hypothetical protein
MRAVTEVDDMTCGELADAAAELALGALTGRERARALEHLDCCGACQRKVGRLTVIAEDLLGLLPGRDPPSGFETGVLDRTALAGTAPFTWTGAREGQGPGHAGVGRVASRRVRGWRRVLAIAACALAAAGAGAGGWILHPAGPQPSVALRSAALITPAGHQVGRIFAYGGGPAWLYVQVDTGSGEGPVSCQVTGTDGRVTTVGTFWLTDGRGAWGSPDGAANSSLTGARLVAAGGTVVATASFGGG